MQHLRRERVANDVEVSVFELPYFIASKLEAFTTRGKRDWLASHDLEDVIAVIDGSTTAQEELSNTEGALARYLRAELGRLAKQPDADEIIMAHLTPGPTAHGRAERIAHILEHLTTH